MGVFSEKYGSFFRKYLNALVNANRGFLMPILGKDNNTQMNKRNQTSIDFNPIQTGIFMSDLGLGGCRCDTHL